MSTYSMVLLCTGAAASLAGVWALAGLSETSSVRATPRGLAAGGVGLLGVAAVYQRVPPDLRGELSLPILFGAVAVLALAAGAAKLDAALTDKDGPRAVRRSAGLIAGTFLAMAAVAAASLELVYSSLSHARWGWACMLPIVAAAWVAFAQRGRLAGAGALRLGWRGLVVGCVGLLLLGLGRFSVSPKPATAAPAKSHQTVPPSAPEPVAPSAPEPPSAPEAVAPETPEMQVPSSASLVPSTSALASAASTPSASASALAPTAGGAAGAVQIESVVSRGLMEADVRGGVERRKDRLQACLAIPKNQQSGTLTLKVGIDASGSVGYARAKGGDLIGTPLATCLLAAFYKMGFAAPGADNAYFEITLRAPPR